MADRLNKLAARDWEGLPGYSGGPAYTAGTPVKNNSSNLLLFSHPVAASTSDPYGFQAASSPVKTVAKGVLDDVVVDGASDAAKAVGRAVEPIANGYAQVPRLTAELGGNTAITAASQVPKALNWLVGNGYKSDWADRVRDNMYFTFDGAPGSTGKNDGWGTQFFWNSAAAPAAQDFGAGVLHGFAANPAAAVVRGTGRAVDYVAGAPEFRKSTERAAADITDAAKSLYGSDVFESNKDFRDAVEAAGPVTATALTAGAGKVLGAASKLLPAAGRTVASATAAVPMTVYRAGAKADPYWQAANGRTQYVYDEDGKKVPYYENEGTPFKVWDNLMALGFGPANAVYGSWAGEGAEANAIANSIRDSLEFPESEASRMLGRDLTYGEARDLLEHPDAELWSHVEPMYRDIVKDQENELGRQLTEQEAADIADFVLRRNLGLYADPEDQQGNDTLRLYSDLEDEARALKAKGRILGAFSAIPAVAGATRLIPQGTAAARAVSKVAPYANQWPWALGGFAAFDKALGRHGTGFGGRVVDSVEDAPDQLHWWLGGF